MYIRNPITNEWEEVFLPPTGDTYPIGMYGWLAGEKAPTNWLRCDGQEISRTEYKELFNAIGTTYGVGDGSTTFNLPNVNLENRTLVGSSGDGEFSLGNTGGEKEHTLTIDEMPSHSHKQQGSTTTGTGNIKVQMIYNNSINTADTGNKLGSDYGTQETGGDQPHNNMQPYIASVCCIKAKQSVGLVGNVVSDMNAQGDNDVAPTKVIKEYVDKSIITAYLTTPIITTTDGFIKCQLDSSTSLGNKFILENGSIKIGKGVAKIKVNGNVTYRYDSGAIDVTGAYIKKNEETISQSSTYKPDNTKAITASCSPFIVDVVEGDIISLYGYGQSSISTRIVGNQTSRVTFMTVEVVEYTKTTDEVTE